MKFMMLVRANADTEAGVKPSNELIEAMTRYNEELAAAGALIDLNGLHPSFRGARVSFSRGKVTVTDGPFAEAKELIAGYWLIEAQSLEEAIGWAKRIPAPFGECADGAIEVRQVFGHDEFCLGAAVDRAYEKQLAVR
jgi:hypothetical protein